MAVPPGLIGFHSIDHKLLMVVSEEVWSRLQDEDVEVCKTIENNVIGFLGKTLQYVTPAISMVQHC